MKEPPGEEGKGEREGVCRTLEDTVEITYAITESVLIKTAMLDD